MTRPGLILLVSTLLAASTTGSGRGASSSTQDWLSRWQANILAGAKDRYCDTATGEDLGWQMSPFLNGFYYGYLATGDARWVDLLVDWTDSWIARAVQEPDGYPGWPKADGSSTSVVPGLYTDNMLGEAMALFPVIRMAAEIQKTPALADRYGPRAAEYIRLSERIFQKWDARGCWRKTNDGGVWVVPRFGIDRASGRWTDGYARRDIDGFTMPTNKQNLIAEWLVAMTDATGNSVYRRRAAQWWRIMKSRMILREGKYLVWDYWEPGGSWDRKPDGSLQHWVGVHTNGEYYAIDVESIVTAYEHNLVFGKPDIDRLVATNRDFMWDQRIEHAGFAGIDGGPADPAGKHPPASSGRPSCRMTKRCAGSSRPTTILRAGRESQRRRGISPSWRGVIDSAEVRGREWPPEAPGRAFPGRELVREAAGIASALREAGAKVAAPAGRTGTPACAGASGRASRGEVRRRGSAGAETCSRVVDLGASRGTSRPREGARPAARAHFCP